MGYVMARWTGLEPEGRKENANFLAFLAPHDGAVGAKRSRGRLAKRVVFSLGSLSV